MHCAHQADTVKILYLFGADVEVVDNVNRRTPLMEAVWYNKVDAVRLLLDLNADTTKNTPNGFDVPSWNVSQTNNEEIRELLLKHSKKSVSNE